MRRMILGLALLAACGEDGLGVAPEANPLGSTANILPYPSSLYERADAASPTGVSLDVPDGAFPANADNKTPFDPKRLLTRHGWPATTTLLWAAPGGVDPAGLPPHTDIAASLGAASSTVILDMTTGERVPHFAEVDANEYDHFDRQAVYLRPAVRLVGGHRYAAAVRSSLHTAAGKPIPITDGFQAILDNRPTGHARLDAARPRLREAIAALETAGIPRADLVVAWDFTVEDDASAIADSVAARDAALAAMGPLGANLTYTVTSDLGTINSDPRIVRRIELDFEAPAVTLGGLDGYRRDASGTVIAQGTMTAHVYIMVPACAAFDNKAGLLIYGHGFFGSLEELRNNEYSRDIAQDGCYVVAGTLWIGMSQDDIPNALLALNDLNKGWGFGEGIFQGMTNSIALEQLLRGKLATEVLVDSMGRSIVDTTHEYFLGISLGHILGSTFFAYDPFITRAVLHVGGANWPLMFERSKNWSVYGVPLKGSYANVMEADIMEQVLEMEMEGIDGATVASMQVPGTPDKQLLMHTSIGDSEVPNLAAFYQARSLGLTLLTPPVTVPFGFETQQAASSSRAWVIVDEHVAPLPPDTNEVFGFSNAAHENPRRRTALQQAMRDFWSTGVATNTCTGTCDCAAGNCGTLRTPMYGGH